MADGGHDREVRHIVVTGASSGIGRAVALELAQEGSVVHVVGRDARRLEDVAKQAANRGATSHVYRADLTNDNDIDTLARELVVGAGRVHILVHSAGVVALGSVKEARIEDLDWQYKVNLRAPFRLTQLLLDMLARAKGTVVFVNSGAGLRARGSWSQYAATKHGLRALSDSFREELAASGIRVTSVYPGRVATPMQRLVHEQEGRDYEPSEYLAPEDVAAQVGALLALPRRAEVTDLSIRPGP